MLFSLNILELLTSVSFLIILKVSKKTFSKQVLQLCRAIKLNTNTKICRKLRKTFKKHKPNICKNVQV